MKIERYLAHDLSKTSLLIFTGGTFCLCKAVFLIKRLGYLQQDFLELGRQYKTTINVQNWSDI